MRRREPSKLIEGDGFRFEGDYPVLEAVPVENKIFVIYDWMSFDRDGPARNLYC